MLVFPNFSLQAKWKMYTPVIRFIERKFGPRWGNMIVWLSLIIGQPLIIMSYYHDFVVQHYGSHLIQAFGNDTA